MQNDEKDLLFINSNKISGRIFACFALILYLLARKPGSFECVRWDNMQHTKKFFYACIYYCFEHIFINNYFVEQLLTCVFFLQLIFHQVIEDAVCTQVIKYSLSKKEKSTKVGGGKGVQPWESKFHKAEVFLILEDSWLHFEYHPIHLKVHYVLHCVWVRY